MKNKKGFTLVELLVVIAIIAILAAVVAPNAFKAIEKSKITAIEADYRTLKTATLMYFSDTGVWPTEAATAGDDPGFITNVATDDGWNGPYIDVWQSESPIGEGYVLINGEDATGPGTGTNLTTIIPGEENAIYLMIDNLPESAFDILEADLGDTIVFRDATAAATGAADVYLKIADK